MITIDKLCYQSGLRHVNAGEKFAFAMITLLLCVVSRSIACACIVLAATGILTVWKGGIPVFSVSEADDRAAGVSAAWHPGHHH